MKLLLLGSLLLSGTGAAAMQNETVNERVNEHARPIIERIQQRFKGRLVDRVKEEGFPYPSEAYLETLSEEDATLIVTTIDQINATYDWNTMSDEEILDALALVKEELHTLFIDLDVSPPFRFRQEQRREMFKDHMVNRLKEEGIPYPSDEYFATLTEEQQLQITQKIDELNATYDFETMTDEELTQAARDIHADMHSLFNDLGVDPPLNQLHERIQERRHRRNQWRNRYYNNDTTSE